MTEVGVHLATVRARFWAHVWAQVWTHVGGRLCVQIRASVWPHLWLQRWFGDGRRGAILFLTLAQTLTLGLTLALTLALSLALVATSAAAESASAQAAESVGSPRLAPGDSKQGYEAADYVTDSLSLPSRQGTAVDLAAHARANHLGLPTLSEMGVAPPAPEAIALGRKIFFDRRLSRNKTMSCAMCHIPEQGFSNNELKRPIGFEGRGVKRNAPTLINVVFNRRLFWDAREDTLAQQVWAPLLAHNEMNNPSVGAVVRQLHADPDYARMFEEAFGEPADMLNIGQALAAYQQSLIAGNSRFDRWYYGGEADALTPQEQRGFALFAGEAGCSGCHLIGETSALFTDHQLHNTGVGYADSMRKSPDKVRVQLAPGVYGAVDQARVRSVGLPKENDLGRYEVTQAPEDRWKFRTPSLRNVALTAPYMHSGEFLTLRDVVRFYNQGGVPNELLSPQIRPLHLSDSDEAALTAFLGTLTGSDVAALVTDAFAAPVGDVSAIEDLGAMGAVGLTGAVGEE